MSSTGLETAPNISANTEKNGSSIKWSSWQSRTRLFILACLISLSAAFVTLQHFLHRRQVIADSFERLSLISDLEIRHFQTYFSGLSDKLSTLAKDPNAADAMLSFREAFLGIEGDNYLSGSIQDYEQLSNSLERYYESTLIPSLESKSGTELSVRELLPPDPLQRILQYLYLSGEGLADNPGNYASIHNRFHPQFAALARQYGIYDIYLIDYQSGYILYSMRKLPDFATGLYEGPYRSSPLAVAFRNASGADESGKVFYTDMSHHLPASMHPLYFLSTPVYSGNRPLGAIVFAMDAGALDNRLSTTSQSDGDVAVRMFLAGRDLRYRSNDPLYLADPQKYLKKLKRHAHSGSVSEKVGKLGTTVLLQQVDPVAFESASMGREGEARYRTETGMKSLGVFSQLPEIGPDWILVCETSRNLLLAGVKNQTLILVGISLVLIVLFQLLVEPVISGYASRLKKLNASLGSLSRGEGVSQIKADGKDDLGYALSLVSQLDNRIGEASSLIDNLSRGVTDHLFEPAGKSDRLGQSLQTLRNALVDMREAEDKRKREDEIRNWSVTGIAMFNDILRMHSSGLESLALDVTRNLIQYMHANQGGIFLIEEEEGTRYLNLVASYAYDRQKFLKKRIEMGEGLAGAVVLEKKTLLLGRIPEDYLEITSGLGGSKPGCLLIVPLMRDEQVLGVIELASFEAFMPHEVEFAEKVAESVSAAMVTVRLHQQTSQFLERFQQQAEEMKAQDEELRQNIEELQATHEQMERLKQEDAERFEKLVRELEDHQKLLLGILDEIPGKIFLKDHNGSLLLLNSEVAKVYNKRVEDLIGTSDFDNHPHEQAREYREKELEILAKGGESYIQEEALTGEIRYLNTTKKPFFIPHLNKTGLLGIQFDVSDIKRKEQEALKLAEEIQKKQQEVQSASEALQKEKSLLDALLDSVPEHIYFKDKESRFIRFSRSMLHLFGLSRSEDLTGKSDFDFFADEHARPAFDDEQRIIQTGKAIIDLEEKNVLEDGRTSWVNTTKMPLRDSGGQIIGTFGISKDITRIKQLQEDAEMKNHELQSTEEELRQTIEELTAKTEQMEWLKEQESKRLAESMLIIEHNRKLLIDVLDEIPAKVFLKDESGKFVLVNSAVAAVYNKKPDEIIGTTDFDNHPGEDVESWRKQELEIMETGMKTYVHLEKMQGEERYLNTTKMPFILATTGKTGLLGIQFDVTEIKQLEKKVAGLQDELNLLRKGK